MNVKPDATHVFVSHHTLEVRREKNNTRLKTHTSLGFVSRGLVSDDLVSGGLVSSSLVFGV